MIHSYVELGDTHKDVLCEIGNIGAGNAATSLSAMIEGGVGISVPRVMVLDYDSAVRAVGNPEELGIAIMIRYSGDVSGIVLFMLGHEDAKGIAEMLMSGGSEGLTEDLSDMKVSSIKEIGNILGSAYIGSISTLTGLRLGISVPYVSIGMLGAIMSVPMIEFAIDNSKIMMVDETFIIGTHRLLSHVILFADVPSLNLILSRLGIDA